jgi:hypothetical protein
MHTPDGLVELRAELRRRVTEHVSLRRRLLLVLLVVLMNVSLVTYGRGCRIRDQRIALRWGPGRVIVGSVGVETESERQFDEALRWPPPWDWTIVEWREAVWPWK